jgi:transposase-like protein
MNKRADEQPEVQPTEVKPKGRSRRRYTIAYKRQILTLVSQCTQPGEIGRLLRREGLYSSHLTDWRKQQLEGVFERTEPPVRGPKPRVLDERDRRIAQLEQEKALLERKVHQQTLRAQKSEAQVEFQKKIACLLGSDISELRDDVC